MMKLRHLPSLVCLILILTLSQFCLAASGDGPAARLSWHAPGWAYRAVVLVPPVPPAAPAKAPSDKSKRTAVTMDVAQVRIIHAGAAQNNANDYRIFDAAGQPVPYQVTYHDPRRDTLISFRCDPSDGVYAIYFGNPAATADPARVITHTEAGGPPPAAGPAGQGWVPQTGLVLMTYTRPEPTPAIASPENLASFNALLNQARGEPQGAEYRQGISDSINPFGPAQNYVSVYRGWIHIPKDGDWGFCTASSNASFSFMDGRKLVFWPGNHTQWAGSRGQINATVHLSAGPHYVEYVQEQHHQTALSFLGVRPPGTGHFMGINPDMFPLPREARLLAYETADGRSFVVPQISLMDSAMLQGWPLEQLTRFHFHAQTPDHEADQWQVSWQFGDGQKASGLDVDYIYLRPGHYKVSMTAKGARGQDIHIDWPLWVFATQFQSDDLKAARLRDYEQQLARVDPRPYQASDAARLARSLWESGSSAAAGVARVVLGKSGLEPAQVQPMLEIAFDRCPAPVSLLPELLGELKVHLHQAADNQNKIILLGQLIRLSGVWAQDFHAATGYHQQFEKLKLARDNQDSLAEVTRQALLAWGDAQLLAGHRTEADQTYQQAAALVKRPLSEAARMAQSGLYPQHIDQRLEAGKPDDALELVERWRDEIPQDQLTGVPWFYRGKVQLARKKPLAAIASFKDAAPLLRGSEYEAQNRWLLAQAYKDAGDERAYQTTLKQLGASGLTGLWVDQAQEKTRDQGKTSGDKP